MARPDPTPSPTPGPRSGSGLGPAAAVDLDELFHRAVELGPDERDAFVFQHCPDPVLAQELRELLVADSMHTGGRLMSPASAWRDAPRQLGPFAIERVLGEGGMGTVYLARQQQPVQRAVAVKILKAGLTTSAGRARFAAERQALARMRHPGIATILDGGATDDGRPYLVMELVEGVPLDEWAQKDAPSRDVRLRLFLDACAAVQHAHRKGVLHRDLKPSNILVEANGEGVAVKVIDFGVARVRAADDEALETSFTLPGMLMGTPGYMSPEQLAGGSDADVRSDVYSLGVVLFELLTGQRPFTVPEGPTAPTRLLDRIRASAPPRPSRVAPELGIPRDLDWIILCALDADPERRYPTVDALAAEVRRFLDHEPIVARPPSRAYWTRMFVRRHRGVVVASALGLVALLIGLVVAVQQWQAAATSERSARRNLADFRRLVDDKRLQDLQREAKRELWPAWPDRITGIDDWLRRARALVSRRADLEARAAEIAAALDGAAGSGPARGAVAAREELAYQEEVIERLIDGIDRLAAVAPTDANISGMQRRRAQAVRTGERSLVEGATAWQRAVESIGDSAECPAYAVLPPVPPQMGLVPLGRNGTSGLWEFWHEASGERPLPDGTGGWVVTEVTGMVFVLVPPGHFVMGAVPEAEGAGEAPVDPRAPHMEQFVHEVALGGFFLSRYEMTQGQWLRSLGDNPAYVNASTPSRGHTPDLRHPVEQVHWTHASAALATLGLVLPTEAQWEYACRAGTKSAFAGAADERAVIGVFANFADGASSDYFTVHVTTDEGTDDGYALSAPVGSYRANDWGLHDMHGNVGEWCQDWLVSYQVPARPGDGLREWQEGATSRCWRGGSFGDPSLLGRSAARNGAPDDLRTARVGVRPARPIY